MNKSQLKTVATELLVDNHKLQIKAKGTSMLPLFKEGDEFIIEKAADTNYKIGDILIYTIQNEFIIHRLHKQLKNNKLLLWGDFNRIADLPIDQTQVIARATHFVRNKKKQSLNNFRYKAFGKFTTAFSPISHHLIFYSVIIFLKIQKFISSK